MKRCRKRGYRDRIAADLVLATLARRDNAARPKTECRSYRCPRCRRFHLTSQEQRTTVGAVATRRPAG